MISESKSASSITPLLQRIAGNWWVKVLVQRAIGFLPGVLGKKANLGLARLTQGNIAERPTAAAYRIQRSVRNLSLLRTHTSVLIGGKHVLEVGTGWRGADPALFFLFGANSVTTVDHERWLSAESFRHSINMIESLWSKIGEEAQRHTPKAETRLKALVAARDSGHDLDTMLCTLNINYHIAPSANPSMVGITPGSIDLFYTESVLQRIPKAEINDKIAHVCDNLLKDGGVIFHRTDQRDIHTLEHVGNDQWALNYLRYSDFIFDTFLNGRFISQNRLRESDFINMFEQGGIEVRYVESRLVEGDLERYKTFTPAKRFRDKTPTDVVTRCSLIVGIKSPSTSRSIVREMRVETVEEVES